MGASVGRVKCFGSSRDRAPSAFRGAQSPTASSTTVTASPSPSSNNCLRALLFFFPRLPLPVCRSASLQKHRACDCAAMADGAAPPKPKRSFFKKPSWKQNADTGDDGDPTAMFDGSKQTFSAIMEERERARIKKLQEQEESARKRELDAARRGKRRKTAHDEEHPPARRDEDQRWEPTSIIWWYLYADQSSQ